MDILFVRELKVDTRIGIYDWERQVKQTVLIDLDIAGDAGAAARVFCCRSCRCWACRYWVYGYWCSP